MLPETLSSAAATDEPAAASQAALVMMHALTDLSMMTGSDGVSFLLPQLFLSQQRLQ